MGRDDHQELRFPDVTRRRFDWRNLMTIAAVAIPLAYGAFYLYRNIQAEMAPGEGDLIVNVNTGTQSELETIPGIGPALGNQIIAGRPYQKVEDLERVHGIGRYKLNSIRPYVKVQGETEER
jgi:hypothetical protein